MPPKSTLLWWASDPEHPFGPVYRQAMMVRSLDMSDELMEIVDKVTEDRDAVQKARLRVDTRKWLMAKHMPKLFGDVKPDTEESSGSVVEVVGVGGEIEANAEKEYTKYGEQLDKTIRAELGEAGPEPERKLEPRGGRKRPGKPVRTDW